MNETDRMGAFVRDELSRLLAEEGIEWRLHVTWDDLSVVATIHRGDLAIPAYEARSLWWEPATDAHGSWVARHLARVLWRWWRVYREADETGRLSARLWQDETGSLSLNRAMEGHEVLVSLAPGCRMGEPNRSGRALLYRLGQDAGLKFEDALKQNWMRIE